MEESEILKLDHVSKSFGEKNQQVLILDDLNLSIKNNEIIGILGRSGSGKSTILRLFSNLVVPTKGDVFYKGIKISESNPKISMIFQTFALIPWLNIYENIAIGLEQEKLTNEQIQIKIQKVLNLVGLKGYENAYPKEMSGGMKQRVGFARALVLEPEVLLMDEAFSALDYITSDGIKTDLMDLWFNNSLSSLKSIIIVTHSIEEAVSLCDRIIILSSNPGRIIADVKIDIEHPRDEKSQKFHDLVNHLYTEMTHCIGNDRDQKSNKQKFYPQAVSVVNMFHFLLTLSEKENDSSDIKDISEELKLNDERALNFIDSLILLGFVEVDKNIISLSSSGQILINADEDSQKNIFKEHLVKNVEIVRNIYHKLQTDNIKKISKSSVIKELKKIFGKDQANIIFASTISWARYANLFRYDDSKGIITLKKSLR